MGDNLYYKYSIFNSKNKYKNVKDAKEFIKYFINNNPVVYDDYINKYGNVNNSEEFIILCFDLLNDELKHKHPFTEDDIKEVINLINNDKSYHTTAIIKYILQDKRAKEEFINYSVECKTYFKKYFCADCVNKDNYNEFINYFYSDDTYYKCKDKILNNKNKILQIANENVEISKCNNLDELSELINKYYSFHKKYMKHHFYNLEEHFYKLIADDVLNNINNYCNFKIHPKIKNIIYRLVETVYKYYVNDLNKYIWYINVYDDNRIIYKSVNIIIDTVNNYNLQNENKIYFNNVEILNNNELCTLKQAENIKQKLIQLLK